MLTIKQCSQRDQAATKVHFKSGWLDPRRKLFSPLGTAETASEGTRWVDTVEQEH